jgi:hypothetical protein
MPVEITEGSTRSGTFSIDDTEVAGELRFAGRRTRLTLHHRDFFIVRGEPYVTVHGVLHDLTRVSLIGCLGPIVPGSRFVGEERSHDAEVEPHYVVLGRRHLATDEAAIKAIRFVVSDATMIFNDSDAFGMVWEDTPDRLAAMLEAGSHPREVALGSHPMVAYFNGRHRIFAGDTVIGEVSAHHAPTGGFGSAKGVAFNNTIWTRIAPDHPITLDEAIRRLLILVRFLEVIAGRRQTVLRVELEVEDPPSEPLVLYWPFRPEREAPESDRSLHRLELPIDAVRDPTTFCRVMAQWLARDAARIMARAQFSDGLHEEHRFSSVRLIGAANMFDLLPDDAAPPATALPEGLEKARSQARDLFRALPDSPERSAVLGALGRIGKPVLKRKIRHRAAIVTAALSQPFPHLERVIDLAVEARNHFVHGSPTDLDLVGQFGATVPFLTMLLEFIYLASELVEAGWDAAGWEAGRVSWDHPLGHIHRGYDSYLCDLDAALPTDLKILLPPETPARPTEPNPSFS